VKYFKLSILFICSAIILFITAKEFWIFIQMPMSPTIKHKFLLSYLVILSAISIFVCFLNLLKIINKKSLIILRSIAKEQPQVIYRKYNRYYLDGEILKKYGYSLVRFYLLSQKDIEQIQIIKFM